MDWKPCPYPFNEKHKVKSESGSFLYVQGSTPYYRRGRFGKAYEVDDVIAVLDTDGSFEQVEDYLR